jgi:hypothetical protein
MLAMGESAHESLQHPVIVNIAVIEWKLMLRVMTETAQQA